MVNIFGGNKESIVQENTVEIEHMQEVEINSDIANIVFLTHDKKQIDILLETFVDGPELQVNVVNQRLEITAKVYRKKIGIFISSVKPSKLEIKLPRDFADHYKVQSTAGNIKVANLKFDTAIMKTAAGNIRFENIEAKKLDLESSAGNIKVENINSETLTVQSGAGNIEGDACNGDITAKTGAGNVRFKVNGEQHLEMTSGAGTITAYFTEPEKLNATVEVNAGIGSVKTDIPFLTNGKSQGNLSTVIGQGKNKFIFKTGVGSIRLFADK